mgnify:FL=1
MAFHIGEGYDIHRLVPGRKLYLGGILIPYEKGLLGHSDADVLLPAITDAILGAAGRGDIGERFPPSDERWKDADSRRLLQIVVGEVRDAGWEIVNVDTTIYAEEPKLGEWKKKIRTQLARILGVAEQDVNKAKTKEGMGEVGEGQAIEATAAVLLEPSLQAEIF